VNSLSPSNGIDEAPYSQNSSPRASSEIDDTPAAEELPAESQSPPHTLHTWQQGKFRCGFALYGCVSGNFASKNEMKRHELTQHLQSDGYKCDLCLLGESPSLIPLAGSSRKRAASQKSSNEHKADKVYNRKDLFVQHVRRMHRRESKNSKEKPEMDAQLEQDAQRCYIESRKLPEKSNCGYCGQVFRGDKGFMERMEHVGKHIENDDAIKEEIDPDLQQWAIRHRVIVQDPALNKLVLAEKRGNSRRKRAKTIN
jgi:hypothetical protein